MPANTTISFIILAFVIYITMRGELRQYMGFILGRGA